MRTRVQKWGDSLAMRIPKSFASEIGIDNDSPVEISLADGKLIVVPTRRSGPSLEELLDHVTDENLHRELTTGPAAGDKAW